MQYHPISLYPEPYECCETGDDTAIAMHDVPLTVTNPVVRPPSIMEILGLRMFGLNPHITRVESWSSSTPTPDTNPKSEDNPV